MTKRINKVQCRTSTLMIVFRMKDCYRDSITLIMLLDDHKVTVDTFMTYNYIQPVLLRLKHYLTVQLQ